MWLKRTPTFLPRIGRSAVGFLRRISFWGVTSKSVGRLNGNPSSPIALIIAYLNDVSRSKSIFVFRILLENLRVFCCVSILPGHDLLRLDSDNDSLPEPAELFSLGKDIINVRFFFAPVVEEPLPSVV